MAKIKKKATSTKPKKKVSKRELLERRREKLASKGGGGDMFYVSKPGSHRMRSAPVEEGENAIEVIQYYLGPEIKGVISPASLGLPCALEEHYQALKESDDEDDQDTAGNMSRRARYVMPHYRYKDDKGKEPDVEAGVRLLLMTNGQYQDWIEFYLEDEIGDPSDPIKGFDIKYKREGSGKLDTTYTLLQCKPTKCAKQFRGPYDPEEMLTKILPSYDQTKDYLDKFLGAASDDDDDEQDALKERKAKKMAKAKKSKKPSKKSKKSKK